MTGLKLRAADGEDLQVVSAMLQDAIVPLGEMTYLQPAGRFVMAVNRFRWDAKPVEVEPGDGPVYERVHCAVTVTGVTAVRSRGIDQGDRGQMLNLLSLEADAEGLVLHFAGGGCLRLAAAEWLLIAEDFGEPWPTRLRPAHKLDEEGASPR